MKKLLLALIVCLLCASNASAIIYCNGTGIDMHYSVIRTGVSWSATATGTISNCTISEGGLWVDNDATVTNCIILSTGSVVTYGSDVFIAAGKTVTGTYNLLGDAAKGGAGTYSDGGSTSLWSSNPFFVSTTDFRLTPVSPAINTGTNIGSTFDYAANPVPQGVGTDIGAYEYRSIPIFQHFYWRLRGTR
jgi:hypothetical protein